MSSLRNPPSRQLIDWAIQRVLELRVNRGLKKYLPPNTEPPTPRFESWNKCDECGGLYKTSCRSCNGRVVRARTLSKKESKLSERDKQWNDVYKNKKKGQFLKAS